jgi:hypothetical protein
MIFFWPRPARASDSEPTPEPPAEQDFRSELNEILAFIGSESLTDEEWESLDGIIDEDSTDQQVYEALLTILLDREGVSEATKRLEYYYLAKDVQLSPPAPYEPSEMIEDDSNIFVGADMEEAVELTEDDTDSNVFFGFDLESVSTVGESVSGASDIYIGGDLSE